MPAIERLQAIDGCYVGVVQGGEYLGFAGNIVLYELG